MTRNQHITDLKLSLVKVLKPLEWNDLVETSHKCLRLLADATVEKPLRHQTNMTTINVASM